MTHPGDALAAAALRLARVPAVGYAALVGWQAGWLPVPAGAAEAKLRDGRVLHCQLSDRTQRTMYLGLFEPAETRLVRRLLSPGDTFVDVGAHIGWFTTIASRSVGDTGLVIACEPYPENLSLLKSNLELNACTNVLVVGSAIGAAPGTLTLATAGDSGGVTALDWAKQGKATVPMERLDDLAEAHGPIALLKMDVEGWESHVLEGATQTLRRTHRVLFEVNPSALNRAGSSREALVGALRSSGFTTFEPVREVGLRRFHKTSVENVLASR